MNGNSGTVYRQYFDTGEATSFYAHWNCNTSGGGKKNCGLNYDCKCNSSKDCENCSISNINGAKVYYKCEMHYCYWAVGKNYFNNIWIGCGP